MDKTDKILVLGGTGLVGSAFQRLLQQKNYKNIISPSRKDLNLMDQKETFDFFEKTKPKYILDAAAKVGGIHANSTYPADFIYENLTIQNNIFGAAFKNKVTTLLFLGSSCIYPKDCPQPIKEEYLLTGPLEQTNEPYAIAKIAGIKLAESFNRQYGCNFISLMPTNLYGPNDSKHPENSHVIPGIITRMKNAIENKSDTFEAWGTGNPLREFLHVDDLADACLFVMQYEKPIPLLINVGSGEEISVKDLVYLIAKLLNFKGKIIFNTNYPDGTNRKALDLNILKKTNWKHKINLVDGLTKLIT